MEFADDDFVAAPTDDQIKRISNLANKMSAYEKNVKRLESQLAQAQRDLRMVQEVELPNALAEAGVSSFTLWDGTKLSLKTEVFASITEDKAGAAFEWLRRNDFGAIIKNVISTEFGKGEDERAREAAKILADAGFASVQKEFVHPQTLKAFLREQLNKTEEDGAKEIPLDLFSAHIVNKAKIER